MNTASKIVIGVLLIVCCVLGYFVIYQPKPPVVPPPPVPGGERPESVEPGDKKPDVTKTPVATDPDLDRIISRGIKGVAGMTGRGEDAKWGIGKSANFKYTITVVADSKILSKQKLPNGQIKVEELRTFKQVQESLLASEVDFSLALDTLPFQAFSQVVDAAVSGYVTVTGDSATGEVIRKGKEMFSKELQKLDGIGMRKVLGAIGLKPNSDVEGYLNKVATNYAGKEVFGLGSIRGAISGKSFRINYYQGRNGAPLEITFANADGSPIDRDSEEYMIVKRVNSFIDYNVIPKTDCRPGDTWVIHADDIEEVFDPFADGRYTGKIKVVRGEDNKDGDWTLQMVKGGAVKVISDSGDTTGSLVLEQGNATVDAKRISVKDMFVKGRGRMNKLSRHHWLFRARISGACNIEGRMVTTPIDAANPGK